jgi:hypothetical protein
LFPSLSSLEIEKVARPESLSVLREKTLVIRVPSPRQSATHGLDVVVMRARTRIAAIATLLLLGCVSTVTAVGCVPCRALGRASSGRHLFPPPFLAISARP